METILCDASKFLPISFDGEYRDLRYILDKEKEINIFLSSLVDEGVISKEEQNKLRPTGSAPGILYGLCKVHKENKGDCPPFSPILSDIDTPSYNFWCPFCHH